MADTLDELKEEIMARGFWEDTVKIVRLMYYRHTVMFKEDFGSEWGNETKMTYCNFCGESFTIKDRCTGCGFAHKQTIWSNV